MNLYQKLNISESDSISIVAVTKNQSIEDISQLVKQGVNDLGENRLQEIEKKHQFFPNVRWHFIGRIQSNKIAKIVMYSHLIHSVCEIRHLEQINECAKKQGKIQNILLQLNLANEQTKAGMSFENIQFLIANQNNFKYIKICGMMVIGNNSTDNQLISSTFAQGRSLYLEYQKQFTDFTILSMGMSNDYQIAIENGSNMLRLGRILFT